jgi:hypothetical protein
MRRPFQRLSLGLVLRIVTAGSLVSLIAAAWPDRGPAHASAAQSPPVLQQPAAIVDSPPPALLEVGEFAEGLFDAARLSNWPGAAVALQAMNRSAADLPATFSRPDLAGRLHSRFAEVGDAVATRQRVQTMELANGITRLIAELSEEYQTQLPFALVMLDYYGRELEIGIAAGDRARLKQATADVRQTWNRFERTILQRGAVDEARRFTDIVVQLEGASAPADFVDPTRAELDAVDRLEKIFRP